MARPLDTLEPFITALLPQSAASGWAVSNASPGHGGNAFLRFRHLESWHPDQGWKLHVSATGRTIEAMLKRALGVVVPERVAFKAISSRTALTALNQGRRGLEQVGKCLTLYPLDDSQAVRLGALLVEATKGLRGPDVSTDRRLSAGSPVFYRYGAFKPCIIQLATGELAPSILDPSGEPIVDARVAGAVAPSWASDPFLAAGLTDVAPEPERLIGDRYRRISILHRSARGTVELALDLHRLRRVLLKSARRGACEGADGRDAFDRLTREAEILALLLPLGVLPTPLQLVQRDDALTLVMEEIPGVSLRDIIAEARASQQPVPENEVIALFCRIAERLGSLHRAGWVHGDLSPSNVHIADDGQVWLLDAESLTPSGASAPLAVTPGYASPQRLIGGPTSAWDDIYSVGALMRFAVTGVDPSSFANRRFPDHVPLHVFNSRVSEHLAAVIEQCSAIRREDRYSSASDLIEALRNSPPHLSVTCREPAPREHSSSDESRIAAGRDLARRLGDSIVALARETSRGFTWFSGGASGLGVPSTDLGDGVAGILVALASLSRAFGHASYREALARGAQWLSNQPPPVGAIPGLYAGRAGVSLGLLLAGLELEDEHLISVAEKVGRLVGAHPHRGPDLYTGSAGRLRLHSALWRITGSGGHFRFAREAASELISLQQNRHDGPAWTIPPGYGNLSGIAWPGAAHGSAGIADALLDWSLMSDDMRAHRAVRSVAQWIMSSAQPAPCHQSCVHWLLPDEARSSAGATWCHGTVGIGTFLLRYGEVTGDVDAMDLARSAAVSAAHGDLGASPVLCHGLSGPLALIAETAKTGETANAGTSRIVERLAAYTTEQDGLLVCQSDEPDLTTPELMRGMSGVVLALLSCADDSLPSPLTLGATPAFSS